MILLTIVVFAIILGLLIFVHELGHFVMAKRAGMRVEEFGFGFPPRLFGIRRGETTYSINWIPLGGFVKIAGEDGHSDDPRAFVNKSFAWRFRVLIAGVTMNFLLAWFLFFLGFAVFGTPSQIVGDFSQAGIVSIGQEQISIVAVQGDSPAEYAGFRPGDVILRIGGREFTEIDEMIAYTKEVAGTKVTYELERGEQLLSLDVFPRVDPPEGTGPVGFVPAKIALVKYNFFQSLWLSLTSFVNRTWGIVLAFGFLIKTIIRSGQVVEGLAGPVGIAVLTRDFTRLGLPYLAQFTAIISINLAIINAFPFPALDGGRVLFLLIEKIRGVRSVKWEQVANMVGFFLLILLMVAVTFRDVGRYSEQFKRLFERLL